MFIYELRGCVFKSHCSHCNRYNSSDFSSEQTRLQNAGSAAEEFVSRDKKFAGKIDTNLVSWQFLRQIFADKLFINSIVTVILLQKTIKDV